MMMHSLTRETLWRASNPVTGNSALLASINPTLDSLGTRGTGLLLIGHFQRDPTHTEPCVLLPPYRRGKIR